MENTLNFTVAVDSAPTNGIPGPQDNVECCSELHVAAVAGRALHHLVHAEVAATARAGQSEQASQMMQDMARRMDGVLARLAAVERESKRKDEAIEELKRLVEGNECQMTAVADKMLARTSKVEEESRASISAYQRQLGAVADKLMVYIEIENSKKNERVEKLEEKIRASSEAQERQMEVVADKLMVCIENGNTKKNAWVQELEVKSRARSEAHERQTKSVIESLINCIDERRRETEQRIEEVEGLVESRVGANDDWVAGAFRETTAHIEKLLEANRENYEAYQQQMAWLYSQVMGRVDGLVADMEDLKEGVVNRDGNGNSKNWHGDDNMPELMQETYRGEEKESNGSLPAPKSSCEDVVKDEDHDEEEEDHLLVVKERLGEGDWRTDSWPGMFSELEVAPLDSLDDWYRI